jgi:pimeloyl-ACP methyl ester carboxylesterase
VSALQVDGRPVGVLDAGGGSAPPLLCIHGFTGGKDDFALVLDGLAAHRRVVAVDLPGHGDSPGPDEPAAHELGPTAAWVLRCADALGFADFHLLGHSLGGLVAQRVAAAASQRLRSLVLVSTGLGALRPEAADPHVQIATTARDHGTEAAYALSQEVHETADAGERDLAERFSRLNPAAMVGGARSLVSAMPLGAFLRGIDIPVLVVQGDGDDLWTPDEQALLARTVRGAELAVVPGSAHAPQLENPAACLDVVSAFLLQADP